VRPLSSVSVVETDDVRSQFHQVAVAQRHRPVYRLGVHQGADPGVDVVDDVLSTGLTRDPRVLRFEFRIGMSEERQRQVFGPAEERRVFAQD